MRRRNLGLIDAGAGIDRCRSGGLIDAGAED